MSMRAPSGAGEAGRPRWPGWRTDLRHALRVTVAAMAAYALYAAFSLPQGYWAVFTVVIVMQGSIGGTVGVAVDRMIGTVAGALIGGAAAALHPPGPVGLGVALALAIAATSLLAAVRPNLKVAPVTAAIMLLSATGKLGAAEAAAFRVAEIALGSLIGVAATVLVLPARSRAAVTAEACRAARLVARRLDRLAEAVAAGAPFEEAASQDEARPALAALEAAMGDAERQRTAFLGDHGVPLAVLRSLWRVRNDAVSVGRALASPMGEPAHGVLAAPAAADLRAEAARLRACAEALDAGEAAPEGEAAEAHAAFLAAFDRLRAGGATRELTFGEAGRVFGLGFALESLYRDAADLAQRVEETARGREAPGPPAQSPAAAEQDATERAANRS